jgi:hypothetical protein
MAGNNEVRMMSYDAVCRELEYVPGVVAGKMFGMPILKINGKAFAGTYGDAMIFKLSPTDVERALGVPGATHFDPMGGRPMREWVAVPDDQSEHWLDLSRAALAYVRGITRS